MKKFMLLLSFIIGISLFLNSADMSILNNPDKYEKKTDQMTGITAYFPKNFPQIKDISFFPYICENNKKYMLRFRFIKEKISMLQKIEFRVRNGLDNSGNKTPFESFCLFIQDKPFYGSFISSSKIVSTENIDILAQDDIGYFIEKVSNLKEADICVRFEGQKGKTSINFFGQENYSSNLEKELLCFKEIYSAYLSLKQEELSEVANKANEPDMTFPSNRDFRIASWSMPMKTILFLEKAALMWISKNQLIYDDTFSGFPVYISYVFTKEDKLNKVNCSFQQIHRSKNDYINDYQKIKSILTEKYGTPKTDTTNWMNNLLKDKTEEWGKAITLGHLILSASWENEKSRIILQLKGESGYIHLDLSYAPLINVEKESDMDKL